MSEMILAAIVSSLATIIITLIGRYIDRRQITANAGKSESDMALNLQEIADNAVREQNELRKEINRLREQKKADYELHIIFTLGPPPAVKKVSVKAIEPT